MQLLSIYVCTCTCVCIYVYHRVPLPGPHERSELIRRLLHGVDHKLCAADITRAAAATEGMSGSDVLGMMRRACFRPLRDLGNALLAGTGTGTEAACGEGEECECEGEGDEEMGGDGQATTKREAYEVWNSSGSSGGGGGSSSSNKHHGAAFTPPPSSSSSSSFSPSSSSKETRRRVQLLLPRPLEAADIAAALADES